MTVRPIFLASMAQASPVGPAPMTNTSQHMSGRGSALGLGSVSGTDSAAKMLGMGDRARQTTPVLQAWTGNGDSSMWELGESWPWLERRINVETAALGCPADSKSRQGHHKCARHWASRPT